MKPAVPILRIFNEAKAREFYVDFLGFEVNWAHRFEDNFPVFLQISRGACVMQLSEHHGDACPGAAVRIEVGPLDVYHEALNTKQYKSARPGIQVQPWGCREMMITDPFGNRLIFFDRKGMNDIRETLVSVNGHPERSRGISSVAGGKSVTELILRLRSE